MILEALETKGMSLQRFSELMGISITSARLYSQESRIPRLKRWNLLSKILDLPLSRIEDHYRQLLDAKGLLKHCKYCNKQFYARFEKTLTCSRKCKDKLRPKSSRPKMSTKLPQIRMETREEKDHVRCLINDATKRYLESGLTIEILPAQPSIKFEFDEY